MYTVDSATYWSVLYYFFYTDPHDDAPSFVCNYDIATEGVSNTNTDLKLTQTGLFNDWAFTLSNYGMITAQQMLQIS